jgi:hypothetical protein
LIQIADSNEPRETEPRETLLSQAIWLAIVASLATLMTSRTWFRPKETMMQHKTRLNSLAQLIIFKNPEN